ncbi:ATP-binding protein [Dyadobacter subterraneus]|uniref:ATP-binding protein n=1 Tax=Dyadobacter subterraneus TaxID=2773304 RepID=A0ABR9WM40_9BACT|nr:ATP-binding protein [Dyadobacter subterraneus]MBE9466502.1 ATP-binding protein [Dyadobacter subterraneus]
MLELYPEIQKEHFKLWFSSTTVLSEILNWNIKNRSHIFKEEELKRRLRLFVETPFLSNARNFLTKNNFIIITGQPGAGKTTNAELLIYELIKDNYELVIIDDDIKDVERSLSDNNNKQIFYYDDFLGHTSYEIAKAKGSETALLKILRRVSFLENKKFIFTTRTFILNTAVGESERLRQFNIKAREGTINLEEYTSENKFQLLTNHIEESKISNQLKEVLHKTDIKNFVVNHRNFSPRSVEFITSSETITAETPESFEKFIKNNFDKPDEIWRHAYEQQINEIDRLLLNTMASFGDSVRFEELENAFISRLNYESEFNNFVRPINAFKLSITRLEGGFIIMDQDDYCYCQFLNYSLSDFMTSCLQNNLDEVLRISESATYLSQLTNRLFTLSNTRFKNHISDRLKFRLISESFTFIKPNTKNSDCITLAIFVNNYFDDSYSIISELIRNVTDWSVLRTDDDLGFYFRSFLRNIESISLLKQIKELGNYIFPPLILSDNQIDDAIDLLLIIEQKIGYDIENFFRNYSNNDFDEHFSGLLNDKIEEDIDDLKSYSHAHDFVSEKEKESESLRIRLTSFSLNIKANFSEYDNYDWYEIGIDNHVKDLSNNSD